MNIDPYLKFMLENNGSDLFFTSGAPVKIKIDGKIRSVGSATLDGNTCHAIAHELMSEKQQQAFDERLECDFAISLDDEDGGARFRVNVFRQRGDVGLVLRMIPSKIPSIDDLQLPVVLKTLVLQKRGLILMVGATGSGKSTTLAAMIDHRNQKMADHIITIEDPIEFSHTNKKSVINQREVGLDTHTYANALRAAMREAPNVLLIGEIRDIETMGAAIELCNTGHLVLSTLHANNANQALERIVNLFPREHHRQLFMDLSLNVNGIISQRLVSTTDGKRAAAIEVMIRTPHIAELMLNGEIGEIKEAMKDSGADGMQTFDEALYNLYREDRIDLEEALSNADSRTDLEAKINFG